MPKICWTSSILSTKLGAANDQMVLQTVAGYQLELTTASHGTRPMCRVLIKEQGPKVLDLLDKGVANFGGIIYTKELCVGPGKKIL